MVVTSAQNLILSCNTQTQKQKLKDALNRLRVADSNGERTRGISHEMDSILSEIDDLDRKESSRKKNRSKAFYAMVLNCFKDRPSERSIRKRFRELDLCDAEVEARETFQKAHETFLEWIKKEISPDTKAEDIASQSFSAVGRSLLLDAILSRESYTSARNQVQSATKSKRDVNLIKPRT